jgi:hypothetical protein
MENPFFSKLKGEVIVENIPEEKIDKLEGLINDFEEASLEKDSKNRILSSQFIAKGMLRVLTSKEAMGKKLAKIIKKEFNGKTSFTRCRQEGTFRVKVNLNF